MKSHQIKLAHVKCSPPASAIGASKGNEIDSLLSGKSAARVINVTSQTMAQWRSNRRVEIPFVRVGGRVMYRRSDLDAFIAGNTHGARQNTVTEAAHGR